MARKKAALLDVDGTLIDSNDAHASAWERALSEAGHQVAFDRIRSLIGKGGDKLLWETVRIEKGSPEYERISKRRGAIFREAHLPGLRPFPGARDLIIALRERGIRLVVATSATKDEIGSLLDVAGIRELVDDVKSSSDAENSKPDPDIVLAALNAAECHASEAIMLGDTPYDLQAAAKTGIQAIALRCGGWDDASLESAIAIYDDPADLLQKLESSPFE